MSAGLYGAYVGQSIDNEDSGEDGKGLEAVTSDSDAVREGSEGPPAHLEEPTCPCCIPALGEFGEVPPRGGPWVSVFQVRGWVETQETSVSDSCCTVSLRYRSRRRIRIVA